MSGNELYLAILPMIHLGINQYGLTEQVITMLPRDHASEFFPDEVESYIGIVQRRTQYLTGGHVTGYAFIPEVLSSGRVIVKVIQHVA